jgi:AcrR family transcriptional regulator
MATSTRRPPAPPSAKRVASPAPASPWDTASNRALQREVKRNAVLQTAAQLFNERGYHATSLDDIAERLNVTKPTLYYYVESKDQILLECVRTALDLMRSGIAEVSAAGGSAIDQLKACMRIYTSMEFRRLIALGGEEGSIAPCDPKMAAFMLAGALSWIGRWYRSDGQFTPEEIAEQGIALLLNGIVAGPVKAVRRRATATRA